MVPPNGPYDYSMFMLSHIDSLPLYICEWIEFLCLVNYALNALIICGTATELYFVSQHCHSAMAFSKSTLETELHKNYIVRQQQNIPSLKTVQEAFRGTRGKRLKSGYCKKWNFN